MARQKLTIDLKSLFPGETIEICGQSLYIEPLGIKQLAVISTKLKGLFKVLKEEGVNLENYNSPDNLLAIATTLLDQFPDILEEAANIEISSLEALPIEIIIEILNKVVEVNLRSKDKLEGNFNSLMEKFGQIQETIPEN